MNPWIQRSLLLVTAALLATACGEDPADHGKKGIDEEGQSSLRLSRVGKGIVEAHPGDIIDLQAILLRTEIGPVEGGSVVYQLVEGVAELDTSPVTTDANGLVSKTLKLGDEGQLTVRARSEGAESTAIWRINVAKPDKRLSIVGGGNVELRDQLGQKADIYVTPSQQVTLRVKATVFRIPEIEDPDNPGAQAFPVSGEYVSFQFITALGQASFASTGGSAVVAETMANGEASVTIQPAFDSGNYTVIAQLVEGHTVEWNIQVDEGHTSGACRFNSQCPPGNVCVDGACQAASGGGPGCGGDRGCPMGYLCQGGQCVIPSAADCATCPNGFICDESTGFQCENPDPECELETECPGDFICTLGFCQPTDAADVINVTGHWYTKHKFDVREALPSWAKSMSNVVYQLNRIINGQISGLPSWANQIIKGILQQYIPSWVYTIVGILDSIFTIFSTIEAEGEMQLTAASALPTLIQGEEYWTSFIFYFLPLCQGNLGGGRTPPCARMDVYTSELDDVNLSVDVYPFTARVSGSAPEGQIIIDSRKVDMKLAGLLQYALNQAVYFATGYPTLGEAMQEIIDCSSLDDLGDGVGSLVCEIVVPLLVDELSKTLINVVVSDDILEFKGRATARHVQGSGWGFYPPTMATDLGYTDFMDRNPRDGSWEGKFSVGVSVNGVPGGWRASREPFWQF